MAGSSPQSFPFAYAYSGVHAYAYSGRQAYAYSAPGEAYGFDVGNPMLAAALAETRARLMGASFPRALGGEGDVGATRLWSTAADELPLSEQPFVFAQWGAQPRSSIAQFELMSRVSFTCNTTGKAQLRARDDTGVERTLIEVQRPKRVQFVEQIATVEGRIEDRSSRAAEVLTQVAPPIAYFASVVNLQFGRHPRTLELIDAALQFAYAVGQRFKHALACPRPSDYSATLMPMIEVPQHASLPAGHAIESRVTAELLIEIVPGVKGSVAETYLRGLAHRIADNRVVAGVHFPVDCLVGRLMGDALASFVLKACGVGTCWGGSFNPAVAAPLVARVEDLPFGGPGCSQGGAIDVPVSPLLQDLLSRAMAEWRIVAPSEKAS